MTTNWSRSELEAMPSGDPPSDLLHLDREALAYGTAVDHDGVQGELPQRGLPSAGIARQVGLPTTAHAGLGVQGALAGCPPGPARAGELEVFAGLSPAVVVRANDMLVDRRVNLRR